MVDLSSGYGIVEHRVGNAWAWPALKEPVEAASSTPLLELKPDPHSKMRGAGVCEPPWAPGPASQMQGWDSASPGRWGPPGVQEPSLGISLSDFSAGMQTLRFPQLSNPEPNLHFSGLPGHLSELPPVNEVNTKGQFFRASFGKTPGSKYSSTSGLSPRGYLERQAEFHASTQDEA